MKTYLSFFGALLVCLSGYGQSTLTFGSTTSAPRADATSNLVDWWSVKAAPVSLMSCFGYNNGSQQFLQFFDAPDSPLITVSGFSATQDCFTNATTSASAMLNTGDRVQLTNTVAGSAAGIYYAISTNGSRFLIATTLANARAGTAIDLTGATAAATLFRLPVHVMAIGAADNFSVIVPDSGMGFGRGIIAAVSTTAATYTAGAKDLTLFITLRP